MKKIIYVIVISVILCGCTNGTTNESPKIDSREEQLDILKSYAREHFKGEDYEAKEDNLWKGYFKPLRSISTKDNFINCDMDLSGIYYSIYLSDSGIATQYSFTLICNKKKTIYFYNSVDEDSNPINVVIEDYE